MSSSVPPTNHAEGETFVFSPPPPTAGGDGGLSRGPDHAADKATGQVASKAVGQASVNADRKRIDQTRHDIATLIKEIANYGQRKVDRHAYAQFVGQRIQAAMGAIGVSIWYRQSFRSGETSERSSQVVGTNSEASGDHATNDWTTLGWTGKNPWRIRNNATLADDDWSITLGSLLDQASAIGVPAIVPPGENDPRQQANPITNTSDFPLALIPMPIAGPCEFDYALVAAIENEANVSVYKGYLRFLGQMADLMAGFFASDYARQLHERVWANELLESILRDIPIGFASNDFRQRFIDEVAVHFEVKRIAWCRWEPTAGGQESNVAVLAVTNSTQIDPAADGVQEIKSVVADAIQQQEKQPFNSSNAILSLDNQDGAFLIQDHSLQEGWLVHPLSQRMATAIPNPCEKWGEMFWQELVERGRRRTLIVDQVRRSWWFGGQGAKSKTASNATDIKSRPIFSHPLGIAALLFVVVIAAFLFPMPIRISTSATLTPMDCQTVYCQRDAVVETVWIKHGQSVKTGDPLLKLADDELSDRRIRIAAKCTELRQQTRTLERKIANPSLRAEDLALAQEELQMVRQERLSKQAELEHAQEIEKRLLVHAKRDGVVDAWETRESLSGQPIQRGQELCRIVSVDSRWNVESTVPFEKLESFQRSLRNKTMIAGFEFDGAPGKVVPLEWEGVGPPTKNGRRVRFRVLRQNDERQIDQLWNAESTGRIRLRCGNTTVAGWLLGDLVDEVVRTAVLWSSKATSTELEEISGDS